MHGLTRARINLKKQCTCMEDIFLKTPFLIYFDFFPKFKLPNSGCGLSASTAYTPVFTILNMVGISLRALEQQANLLA